MVARDNARGHLVPVGPSVGNALVDDRAPTAGWWAAARQFEAAFDSAPDPMWIADDAQRCVAVNAAACALFGREARDLVGRPGSDLVASGADAATERAWQALVEQGQFEGEIRIRRADGAVRTVALQAIANILPGRHLAVARDLTVGRQLQVEIAGQRARLAALRTIDRARTASRDLRVILDIILDQVRTQLQVDVASVLLLDKTTETLSYVTGQGFRAGAPTAIRLCLGAGHAGRAALERRTLYMAQLAPEGDLLRARVIAQEGFVAGYAVPLLANAQVRGVLEIFQRAPLDLPPDDLDFLSALADQAAIAIDNATLFHDLQRSNHELALAYDSTLEGWSRALDLRDRETEGHTQRVTELTVRLAQALGLSAAELVHVRRGALLHDIGKMGIPDAILLKPGPLTAEETAVMRRHPVYAYELLAPIPFLRPALPIPYCHHERWDGSGYPRGLQGTQIPWAARIFAVADVWDALRSNRPYHTAWSDSAAHAHLRAQAGIQFDPRVVAVFLDSVLPRL